MYIAEVLITALPFRERGVNVVYRIYAVYDSILLKGSKLSLCRRFKTDSFSSENIFFFFF